MVPSASRWVATATLTSLLSRLETPTPANVLALPCKHRHGRDARSYLALDAEQIRVHLATVEDPVEKVAVKMRGYLANSPRELTVPVEANQR